MENIKNFFSEKITLLLVIIVLLAVASSILLYQFFQLTDEVEKANTALENNEQMLTSKDSEIKTLTETKEDLIIELLLSNKIDIPILINELWTERFNGNNK